MGQRLGKCCSNCRWAEYDSVPYGSTNAVFLSGCKKEDSVTEEEFENEVECSQWEPCNDDI